MNAKSITDKGEVEVLWEKPERKNNKKLKKVKPIRVAAYCRVSTELDVQTESFELQERHYTRLITNTPGWRLAGIYVDHGISGTQSNKRMGFQRMIRHCEEGKIDRIICKSISRFARNAMDLLDTVRRLKELAISVVFEKEGIDTLSVQSEFILSTIAAIAQDESRSISENMAWSFKKRFKRGIPVFVRILGYNVKGKGSKKKITINKKEAAIVKEIYRLALEGMGYTAIARIMMQKGYKTMAGKCEWTGDSVKGILKNERYTGNCLCQKTYTADYLTHKCKRNNGERKQYWVENHHPAIISQETYDEVQKLLSRYKRPVKRTKRKTYPLTKRLKCGECGANYNRYNSECYVRWRCSKSIKNRDFCNTDSIREEDIKKAILKAFERRYDFVDKYIIHRIKLDIKRLQDNDNIERTRVILKRQLSKALDEEMHASKKQREEAKEKRIMIEQNLKDKEKVWNLLEKDREFRRKSIEWIDKLPRGDKRMKIFFEQFNIEYMRAWVIDVTVLSPFLFKIKWFDDKETTVDING